MAGVNALAVDYSTGKALYCGRVSDAVVIRQKSPGGDVEAQGGSGDRELRRHEIGAASSRGVDPRPRWVLIRLWNDGEPE